LELSFLLNIVPDWLRLLWLIGRVELSQVPKSWGSIAIPPFRATLWEMLGNLQLQVRLELGFSFEPN